MSTYAGPSLLNMDLVPFQGLMNFAFVIQVTKSVTLSVPYSEMNHVSPKMSERVIRKDIK